MKTLYKSSLGFASSLIIAASTMSTQVVASDATTFSINVKGDGFDKALGTDKTIFAVHSIENQPTNFNYQFENKNGKKYQLNFKYKKLPSNRSFPSNLDITLKDNNGKKLGYLFFAINGVDFLKQMGEFGLIVNDGGELIDINFNFQNPKTGNLNINELTSERFVQDTLLPSKNFQMIRPVLLKKTDENTLSKTFALDSHPFDVNYRIKQLPNQNVMFEHNLYTRESGTPKLLERIYYRAHDLQTLREGMFAGKYFHPSYGAFKLVFYPTEGQTEPSQK